MKTFTTAFAVILTALSTTISATGTDDQVYPPLDKGTFSNPAPNYRPRFRYWVPDASINLTHLAFDIADVGTKGAGGVEILGYYLYGDVGYGGTNGAPVQVDWTKYGWGTQAWRDVQDTALRASKDNGLIVDFTIGPNQGAGVPAEYNSDGLLWDLASYNITLHNGSFQGVLPGWGIGPLVSVSTGLVTKTAKESYQDSAYGQVFTSTAIFSTLKADTLTDITSQVSDDGQLDFQVPADVGNGNYTLFAYYLVHSEFRECGSPAEVQAVVPQSPVEDAVHNGSWVVDHFSSAGAQVVIDFWENNLLNGSDTKDVLKEVGNYLWEDSMEYQQGVYIFWTKNFTSRFLASRGYSVNKYLPLLFHEETTASTGNNPFYITDESDNGQSHITDYRQTLTELYGEYLATLVAWANSLGVQFSGQPVYNLPMNMLQDMPILNGPEIESLGFQHDIDWYRQAAGPAHLAGKRILSSELGANRYEAYQQTLPEMLWDIKRSIAGSVNNFILHGFPYSGDYPNTTWPSFTTFVYQFSSMHGRHEPAWEFYGDFLNYTARLQYLAQSGTPKIDLAFYLKNDDYRALSNQYDGVYDQLLPATDLERAGFTYHYLDPSNLAFPNAYVSAGVLAPDAQEFKALIVRGDDSMTVFGAQKIRDYAENGLPVIFSGGVPGNVSGYQPNATAYVNTTLSSILTLSNVHQVGYDGLADSLLSLGVTPRAAVNTNSSTAWFPQWRLDNQTETEHVYVYNDGTPFELGGGYSTGNVTLEVTGTPYWYDTWTGETSPVLVYSQTKNTTTIPLQLKGNQTAVIGFEKSNSSCIHVDDTTAPQYYSVESQILATADDVPASVSLSNGSSLDLAPPTTPATTLGPWNLIVESWNSTDDRFDVQTTAAKQNLSAVSLSSLVPWVSISPSLANVSGRGYYSTSFTWPLPASNSRYSNTTCDDGALLDLGVVFHTAKVWVNGAELPPLDVSWPRADIKQYLVTGVNSVDIVVSTPLGNVLRPVWGSLLTSGKVPQSRAPPQAAYGLIEDVRVVPYTAYAL